MTMIVSSEPVCGDGYLAGKGLDIHVSIRICPDRTTTAGQASVTASGTASQYIDADSWDQQITTGDGNDLVIAGQWELPAGASDSDIVNTGAGSDLVFTGQGRDIIDAGAGDDFIMSGGEATVASMQSEDPANQVPAGATWVQAGLGSWAVYNDSVLGDLGGRLTPYGIYTAQFWQTGATDVAGDIVDAGTGNDKVYGGQGDEFMQLGDGNDFAVGYAGG